MLKSARRYHFANTASSLAIITLAFGGLATAQDEVKRAHSQPPVKQTLRESGGPTARGLSDTQDQVKQAQGLSPVKQVFRESGNATARALSDQPEGKIAVESIAKSFSSVGSAIGVNERATAPRAAVVQQLVMTHTLPTTCSTTSTPILATTFATTDPAAYLWAYVSGLNPGDVPSDEYYQPNGTFYAPASGSFPSPATAGSYCYSDPALKIAGFAPASIPGTWSVRFKVNGVTLATTTFNIGSASGGSAQVQQLVMTHTLPTTCSTTSTPPLATTFATTDPAAYLWAYVSGLNPGDVPSDEYYQPNGTFYAPASGSFPSPATAGSYCYSDPALKIAGFAPASIPGTWSVKFKVNGNTLGTTTFTISAPAPSAQVQQLVMTHTLPTTCSTTSTPPLATTFATTDAAAYLWAYVSALNPGDVPSDEYYQPNGTFYAAASGSFPSPSTFGSYCYSDPAFKIAGFAPASITGTWSVKFKVNGVTLGTTTFTIVAPATAQVQQLVMTHTLPTTCSTTSTPPLATTFSTTDVAAYLWAYVSGLNPGDVPSDEYYQPNGTFYAAASGSFPSPTTFGSFCYSDPAFKIAGFAPASITGTWSVKFKVNGVTLGTTTFTIAAPAPSAQVQQLVMTHTLPTTCSTTSTPPLATSFATTDVAAYLWAYVSALNPGDVPSDEYYQPNGTFYAAASGTFPAPTTFGSYCYSDPAFKIAGFAPATITGTWSVKFKVNGVTLGTTTFNIAAATPSAQVQQIMMTHALPATCSSTNPPVPATTFAPTDPVAYLWAFVTSMNVGDIASDEYYDPTGTFYAPASGSFPAATTTNTCFNDPSFKIAGATPASKPGTWTVKFKVNGVQLATLTFTIGSPTPPAGAQVQQIMMTRSLPGACNVATPPTPATSFQSTEAGAYPWTLVSGLTTGVDVASDEFYQPNGSLYVGAGGTYAAAASASVCYSGGIFAIAGTPVASLPGTWTQKFKLNGVVKATNTFTITAVTPPPNTNGPSIAAVVDFWTYVKGVSPGEWVSIYGNNFTTGGPQLWAPQLNQAIGTSLGGVTVTFDGVLAGLQYVSATQINALVPSTVRLGQINVVVTNQGNVGTAFSVPSTQYLPSIYSNPLPGTSPTRFYVTAVNPVTGQLLGNISADGRVARGVRGGDTIDLYTLGLGPTTPFVTNTIFSGSYPLTAGFTISLGANASGAGGFTLTPSFAALVAPGLYQVRFTVPNNMPTGDQLIVLQFGQTQSAGNVYLTITP